MIYILNNLIKYNSDSGEVFKLDSNEEIAKLTPILNHIFIILIENNGVITPREELLKIIFESHNLNVSINTLNQYISILRKLLHQQLNIENAILNISKKGIILSSEIIIAIDDEVDPEEITNENNEVEKTTNTPITLPLKSNNKKSPLKKEPKNKFNLFLKALIFILFLTSIYLLIVLNKNNSPYKSIDSLKISDINGCPVFSFQNNTSDFIKSIMDDHIKEFKLTCKSNDTFYYYNNSLSSGENKQSLLVECEKNKTCISTRINWRGKYEK